VGGGGLGDVVKGACRVGGVGGGVGRRSARLGWGLWLGGCGVSIAYGSMSVREVW